MIKDTLLLLFHAPLFYITTNGMIHFYSLFNKAGFFGNTEPIIMLCFLTIWGQVFLIFFFLLSSLIDLLNIFKFKKNNYFYYLILKARDLLFRSIVFPIGLVITTLFWSIYHWDRELIFSVELDKWFPRYLNHLHHTLPGILILIETLLVNHQYHNDPTTVKQIKENHAKTTIIIKPESITPFTSDLKQDIANLISFILFYIGIIVFTRFQLGFWVYPVLAVIPIHSKIIFIFSSSCFGVALYIIGRAINQKRWGGESIFMVPNLKKINSSNNNKNSNINSKKLK